MNIEHALTVQGWMTELELAYLAEAASKSSLIVEVGSWMGRSTSSLAANTQGRIIAVDTWKGSPEHAPMLEGKSPNWLKIQFMDNTGRYPNIVPAQMESGNAATLLRGLGVQPDMVFIDANHDYGHVAADIVDWTKTAKDGAIICGHDYDPVYWPGIVRAVNEFVPKFRVVPNATIWTTEGV